MARRLQRSRMIAAEQSAFTNTSLPSSSWGHTNSEPNNPPGVAWWGSGQWAPIHHPLQNLDTSTYQKPQPLEPASPDLSGWFHSDQGKPIAAIADQHQTKTEPERTTSEAGADSKLALVPCRAANRNNLEKIHERGFVVAGEFGLERNGVISGVSIDISAGIGEQDVRKILRTPQTLPFVQYVCSSTVVPICVLVCFVCLLLGGSSCKPCTSH
jgi:hypothetical protein